MARSAIYDPLEKFRFLISWEDGLTLAGFHDCQIPKRTTGKVPYREGIDQDITTYSAGLNTFEDVVLSRGLLASGGGAAEAGAGGDNTPSDFYNWILQIHDATQNPAQKGISVNQGSIAYRKNITITMLDRDGAVGRVWKLYNAWPTHYMPGSDLNAGEDAEKSMEGLTLAYEDFTEMQLTNTASVVPSGL